MILRGFIHKATGRLTAMLAVLFSVLSLYSCSSDSEQQKPQVAVAFQIVLPQTTTYTRAANTDWSDYDPSDPGNEMENRIDLNDIQVVFLKSDNSVTLKVSDLMVTPTATPNIYNVTATIDDSDIVGTTMSNVKVMVFVNCENTTAISSATTADNFKEIAFKNSEVSPDKWANYIPMWGVSTISLLTFTPGKQVNIRDIWLLRSKAKISVSFDKSVTNAGYTLVDGSLKFNSKVQTDFYCLPSAASSAANTKSMTYSESFHPYDVASAETSTAFTIDAPLYTPEYDNTSAGAYEATITFSLNKGGTVTHHKLQFKNYDSDGAPIDGSDYDIVRNHWYKFEIYTTPSSGPKVKLIVQPWAKFTHSEIVM